MVFEHYGINHDTGMSLLVISASGAAKRDANAADWAACSN